MERRRTAKTAGVHQLKRARRSALQAMPHPLAMKLNAMVVRLNSFAVTAKMVSGPIAKIAASTPAIAANWVARVSVPTVTRRWIRTYNRDHHEPFVSQALVHLVEVA